MSAGTDLVPLSAARRALAEADSLPDIARLVDYAEAAKVAAKRAGLSEDACHDWQAYSLEAQRKAGQLLRDMPKAKGGGDNRPGHKSTGDATSRVNLREVLDANTNTEARQKAKRWQDVAEIPADVFDDYLANTKELTRSRLLRLGRDRRAAEERERLVAAAPDEIPDVDLRVGDFREVLADLRDVDAIITDPPYPKEFLPLLGDLAEWSDEALADDGVLAVMFGQTHLPDVYRLLAGGRPYRWTIAYLTPAAGYASQARRLQSNWKPVLVYGGGPRFADVVTAAAADKAHHHWGQDYGGFATLVERLTAPGAHVVDPFLGGGTTAVAARNLGRRFTGCDVDPDAVATTRGRLAASA